MFKLDAIAATVTVNGAIVPFTGKEYAIVELLYLKGGIVTKNDILAHLYESPESQPEMKILDVFLCKIRRKFKVAGAPDAIATIWGRGFQFNLVAA
jgi:two-component system cell cycle response regulator CtrA